MQEPIKDTRELTKLDGIEKMKKLFNDPYRLDWSEEELKKLDRLYDAAQKSSPEDPIGWLETLNNASPRHLNIDGTKSRLDKMIVMASSFEEMRASKTKSEEQRSL